MKQLPTTLSKVDSKIFYFDFTKDGIDYIGNRDIPILTNNQAILESVKNIILTEPGDNIFDPSFGCPIYNYLFEPIDTITTLSLRKTLMDTLTTNEPRIDNININVFPDTDNLSYIIDITFDTVYSTQQVSLKMNLNKIR